ncbi:MAG: kynureninase [Natronospirillum sp.]
MTTRTLAHCQTLDAADPLRPFKTQFHLPDGVIYLDGNSLGCMPKAAAARVKHVVEHEWAEGLIRSWNNAGWVGLSARLGGKIAPLIGAQTHEVRVTDSTSVNLFKLVSASLKLRPGRHKIITEPGNFPTDRYIIQGVCTFMDGPPELVTVPADQLADALDNQTALLLLTHVHYKSGRLHDMVELTARAQQAGALVLWDLSHSVGALPVALNECNADMAVGCGYKYLNGGPGAPAFVYVAERHHPQLMQPIFGWFGHADPFAMSDDYTPAPGLDRAQTGTPSVLGASAMEVGLDLFHTVDMKALRQKSMTMTELFIELVENQCIGHGFELVSPRQADQRGSQVSFSHPEGYAIMRALIDRGVIGDFRAPNIVRFGFAPLYLSYEDVWSAVQCLTEIMDTRAWDAEVYQQRQAVT